MMVMSLTKIGYEGECLSEHWVNYLGITSVLVGTAVAICVGMVTDRIKGKMKITILGLLVLGMIMKSHFSFTLSHRRPDVHPVDPDLTKGD